MPNPFVILSEARNLSLSLNGSNAGEILRFAQEPDKTKHYFFQTKLLLAN